MHKILVAEDDVATAAQLEEHLLSLGYEVVGKAYSGESAIKIAKDSHPDLILLDIDIPGKSASSDAAETIEAELDIPVIFLTDSADDKFVERAKKVEPFGYITKPFHESEIKAAVEGALYRKNLERQLRKSNEELMKYKALSENIPEGLLIIDSEGNVLFVNDSGARMFGFEDPEEEIGKNALDFVTPDRLSNNYQTINR